MTMPPRSDLCSAGVHYSPRQRLGSTRECIDHGLPLFLRFGWSSASDIIIFTDLHESNPTSDTVNGGIDGPFRYRTCTLVVLQYAQRGIPHWGHGLATIDNPDRPQEHWEQWKVRLRFGSLGLLTTNTLPQIHMLLLSGLHMVQLAYETNIRPSVFTGLG